jgi:hypothetical protein
MVIPFEEGIIEVSVAVTAYTLVNETLLLVALMVNAIGVSNGVGVGEGEGVEPPPSEDLEQEIKVLTIIKRNAIIFFIQINYLLIIIPSV